LGRTIDRLAAPFKATFVASTPVAPHPIAAETDSQQVYEHLSELNQLFVRHAP